MKLPKPTEQSLSVQKAITVLNLIGAANAPLSVTEIVAATSLGKTVVLRILATLSAERFVERDAGSGRYRLGANFITLAQKALRQNPLILRARPVIVEIVDLTGDIGLLMTLDRGMSLCIERRVGASPIATLGTDLGTRSPIHGGGGPFALLAFSDDSFVEEYLSRPLHKMTARTVVDPVRVRERISEARERGFTIGEEDLFEYIVAIGVPIRGVGGELLGSLSVGSINHRYPHERCIEVGYQLKEIAARHCG
jgi:DNA-binding IclR family transcriptional regulator